MPHWFTKIKRSPTIQGTLIGTFVCTFAAMYVKEEVAPQQIQWPHVILAIAVIAFISASTAAGASRENQKATEEPGNTV